jgi:hypothetical protein
MVRQSAQGSSSIYLSHLAVPLGRCLPLHGASGPLFLFLFTTQLQQLLDAASERKKYLKT